MADQPEEIELNGFKYSIKLYLRNDEIIFEVKSTESPRQYSNHFDLDSLKNTNPEFKFKNTLFENHEWFKNLIKEKKYVANIREEHKLELMFVPLVPTNFPNLEGIPTLYFKVILNLYELEKSHIKYDSLSNQMKELIDNDNLILGIDLGTTYSTASIMIDDKLIVIPNSLGSKSTPSYVMFLGPNKRCAGDLAKLYPSDKKNIIFNSKRLLGQNYNDSCIREFIEDAPFDIIQENSKLKIKVKFDNNVIKTFYPEQISAMILKKLIEDSEFYLTEKIGKKIKIKKAVMTVPAYFNQKQREATKQAAEIINLEVVKMINEPTAASLAYAFESIDNNIEKYITVIDFGGGTLDITLLQFLKNEKGTYCNIIFTYGDTHFGGEDFDYAIMADIIHSKDFDKKKDFNIRLKKACEKAKIELSYKNSTVLRLEQFRHCRDVEKELNRNQFENICSKLFNKFNKILKDFLEKSGFKNRKNEIAEIILIGGSILIPKIKKIIKDVFNHSAIKDDLGVNEAVSKGASIEAAMKSNLSRLNYLNLLDVTNLSFGVKLKGDIMNVIIKRSTPIPIDNSQFYWTAEQYQTAAKIEIYEGEDKNVNNNLFLGTFTINNLPSLKTGAKIKVIIKVDENSLLDVEAIDDSNINHKEELKIEKPKGLKNIMNQLKTEENQIINIDLEEFKKEDKNMVIEYQEKIYYSNNIEENKKLYKSLIEYLGKVLRNINGRIEEDKTKIFLSYIAYYFSLIRKYLTYEKEENLEKAFVDEIKNNITEIMNQIQFYNTDIICYFTEYFVGCNDLYITCIYLMVKNLNGMIEQLILENKKIINQDKALDGINKILEKLESSKHLLNKINQPNSKEIEDFKTVINDYFLILEVRKFIINFKKLKLNVLPYERGLGYEQRIKELLDKYKKSKIIDYDDLAYLENINIVNEKGKINFCLKMIDDFEICKDFSNAFRVIYYLNLYFLPPNSGIFIIDHFKCKQTRNEFLIQLISVYTKEKQNQKKEIFELYEKIIIFLNKVKNNEDIMNSH